MRYPYCMNQCFASFFTFLLLCLPAVVSSQVQRDDQLSNIGSTRVDTVPTGITPLDTLVPMSYVLIRDPTKSYTFSDTFTWENNKHFPLSREEAYLGNYGSASRPFTPSAEVPLGFSTGWLQYEPYYLHEETFRYYHQDVPVSIIKYSQAGKDDTYLDLDFGRSFAKGFNLSVAYRRINQLGEFNHQRQKDTGFSIGIWHDAPSGKYDAFYNYLNNAAIAQENGGIAEPDSIGKKNNPDASIPIYLTSNDNTAITTHKHRTFLTKQILHLTPDSSQFGIDVWLKEQFSASIYKYADEDAQLAAEYYGTEYLFDDRGIRQYTYMRENQLSMGVSLPWKAAHSTLHSSLRYRSILLQQEPTERHINELYVDLAGDFNWVEPLTLSGQLSLGLGQADGVFSFQADADLSTGVAGHLLGNWSIVSRNPYMVESQLYVNQQLVYKVELNNPFINEIGVGWKWEKQHLEAGIKWLVFDNYIYFDSTSFPKQLNESFSLRRLYMSKDFDFRWIGLKGSFYWQPQPPAELAIPEIGYTATMYSRINLFKKKVQLMPGVDVMYHGGFDGISYFPVNGRYHLTGGPSIPDYFRIDVALGLQIKFLKIFARMEDFVGLFEDRVLYEADYYPHYRGYFRIGIQAGFFN